MTFKIDKDPNADLNYSIDWTQWLTGSETIASSTWAVDPKSGMTMHDAGLDVSNKIATVWLRGGAVGLSYPVTNSITTNSVPPRKDDRSIYVSVIQR
jgi:hypothetical protein